MNSIFRSVFFTAILFASVSAECDGVNDEDACVKAPEKAVFVRYLNKIKNCVKMQEFMPDKSEAILHCSKDPSAQKSLDCFVFCLWNKLGAMSEKTFDGKKYLVEDFNIYAMQMAKVFPERKVINSGISTMSRCKALLPDNPLFPTLDSCENLNGFYKCAIFNFLKQNGCEITQEDKQFLGVLDLDILGQRRRK